MQIVKKIGGGVLVLFGVAGCFRAFAKDLPEGTMPMLTFLGSFFLIALGLLLLDVFKRVKPIQDNYIAAAFSFGIIGVFLIGIGARTPKKPSPVPAKTEAVVPKKDTVLAKKDTIATVKKTQKKAEVSTASVAKPAKPKPKAEPTYYSTSSSGLCGAPTKKGSPCRNKRGSCPHHRR